MTSENHLDDLVTWRHDLHAHPETAFEENRTAEFVAAHPAKADQFAKIDANQDGFIDEAERKAHHAAKGAEGKCGEKKAGEGKCGEGKCGEGKCGGDKKTGDK